MALIPGTLPTGTKYPNDPQSLLDTFASYLTAPESKKNRASVSTYSPAGGGTVTFNSAGQDETMVLDLGGAITNLTVVFPPNANSAVGQIIRIFAGNAVNGTVSYTNGTRDPSGPTTFADNTTYAWQKINGTTWVRI